MNGNQAQDQSVSDLMQRLSNQTATLVRKEIQLAQLELQEKGKRAGIAGGMFGGAGVVALYGVGALVATAILALATAVEPCWSQGRSSSGSSSGGRGWPRRSTPRSAL